MDPHELAEERSLAYHARVAELLRDGTVRVDEARARVAGWVAGGRVHPVYAAAWREILQGPLADVCALLEDRGERARALRQVTPFAGALPPRERWSIWRETRARLAG